MFYLIAVLLRTAMRFSQRTDFMEQHSVGARILELSRWPLYKPHSPGHCICMHTEDSKRERERVHGSLEPPIGQGLIYSQETKCIELLYDESRFENVDGNSRL